MGERCSTRATPGTKGKDVQLGEANLFNDAAGGLEIRVGFAGKADDDVGRERWLIQCLPESAAALEKPRALITPLHQGQDPIRTALETQVQVGADALGLSQGLHELASNLRRLQAAQPHAKVARQLI